MTDGMDSQGAVERSASERAEKQVEKSSKQPTKNRAWERFRRDR